MTESSLEQALMYAWQNGAVDQVAREAVRTAVDELSKATPSRGQIAAQIMAGFAACPAEFSGIKEIAEVAVEWTDALLAELAKPTEASR